MVKKKAPKVKDAAQYCIDGVLVEDVLKEIPESINIIGCRIKFGHPLRRQKVVVPKNLQKWGVDYLQQVQPTLEAFITLDATTPGKIRKAIKAVAQEIGIDAARAEFGYIVLSNGDGAGKFVKCTKEMQAKGDDAADLRKKLKVLGITDGSGKVQSLIKDLGADKFTCNIEEVVERRIITCSRDVK